MGTYLGHLPIDIGIVDGVRVAGVDLEDVLATEQAEGAFLVAVVVVPVEVGEEERDGLHLGVHLAQLVELGVRGEMAAGNLVLRDAILDVHRGRDEPEIGWLAFRSILALVGVGGGAKGFVVVAARR